MQEQVAKTEEVWCVHMHKLEKDTEKKDISFTFTFKLYF